MKMFLPLFACITLLVGGCGMASELDCASTLTNGPVVVNKDKTTADYYMLMSSFDSKNAACWQVVHTAAIELAEKTPVNKAVTIHFLDTTAFSAPKQGLYGSEEVQRKVIAVHHRLPNGEDSFTADPNGYGKYKEVRD